LSSRQHINCEHTNRLKMGQPTKAPGMLGGTAIRPVERHGMEAVRYFFHNPDTGEIMTRTPMSWLLITIFYVIYYSCLAAFWAICMVIFLRTVPENEPKWQTSNGIIGESPGVGFVPKNSYDLIDSAIVMFNKDSKMERDRKNATEMALNKVASYQEWTARIRKFLQTYKNETEHKQRIDCNQNAKPTALNGCKFDVSKLEEFCWSKDSVKDKKKEHFGYDVGSPCVFLKLNKIFGLENTPYSEEFPEAMETHFPDLKTHIKGQPNKDQVWVDCYGKYPADKEILEDAVTYFPSSKGFPNFYFPYKGQKNYVSPLVAVKFTPKKATGQLIHVECRAWAKNIGYNRRDKIGIAVFELHIMDETAAAEYNKE